MTPVCIKASAMDDGLQQPPRGSKSHVLHPHVPYHTSTSLLIYDRYSSQSGGKHWGGSAHGIGDG